MAAAGPPLEHLELGGRSAGFALLTGNPRRVERLAGVFHQPEFVSDRCGLTVYHGRLAPGDERGVFIAGSGIGGPSIAIVIEELIAAGVRTLIRVGTCGALQPGIGIGEIVVPTGVVRDEGTSRQYIRPDFPAVAHHELLFALRDVQARATRPLHFGIGHAKDAFYSEKPDFSLDREGTANRWRGLRDAGVLATEMECATLYVLAWLRRAQALGLVVAVGEDRTDPRAREGLFAAAELARLTMERAAG